MFYETVVLAKKGLLAPIWLAAHWDKKLSKAQIKGVDIKQTADTIGNPRAPMALRLSGHLLLGVVKVYSKKIYYLYSDCSEALIKIKMAFRPGVNVDLDESVANLNAITLSENLPDFELSLPDIDLEALPYVEDGLMDLNQIHQREILVIRSERDRRAQPIEEDLLAPIGSAEWEESIMSGQLRQGAGEEPSRGYSSEAPEEFGPEEGGIDISAVGDEYQDLQQLEAPSFILPELSSSRERSRSEEVDQTPPLIEVRDLALGPVAPTQKKRKTRPYQDTATQIPAEVIQDAIGNPSGTLREFQLAPAFKRSKFGELPEALEQMFAMLPFYDPEASSFEESSDSRSKRSRAAIEEEAPEARAAPLAPGQFEPEVDFLDIGEFGDMGDMGEFIPGVETTGGEPVSFEIGEPRTPSYSRREARDSSMAESVSRRTEFMRSYLKQTMAGEEQSFNALFKGLKKKRVAQSFFELLVLKSKDYIDLKQSQPYGDITIKKTEKFETLIQV